MIVHALKVPIFRDREARLHHNLDIYRQRRHVCFGRLKVQALDLARTVHDPRGLCMMAAARLREYFKVEYRPGERRLVQKVDFFILTFCCLSYFMNYVSTRRDNPTVRLYPSLT